MAIDPDIQPFLDSLQSQITTLDQAIKNPPTPPPSSGGAKNPVLIAASNAPTSIKSVANVVATGTQDQNLVNQAILNATGYGTGEVLLSAGTFNLSGSIIMRTGVWLHGSGLLTELKATNLSTISGYAAIPAVITNVDKGDHLMRVSDLWINGNWSGGGTCLGIGFRCSGGSGSRKSRPDSNPDPDITIHDLFISGFKGAAGRHGVVMDSDCRGSILDRLQIRDCSGDGVWMKDSPDSHLSNIHMGGASLCGFRTTGGNVKFTNCKAFYCDDAGFSIESGRGALSGCESQDNVNGFRFSADCVASALTADTFKDAGFIISSDRVQILGASAFNRGGGRYATSTNGFVLNGRNNLNIVGFANKVTTPVFGTGGGFIRVGSYSVG